MSYFRKIYLKSVLKTELNDKGEEKKNLLSLLPKGYKEDGFDYSQSDNKHRSGHVIVTGKMNNITVLDFDDMDVYNEACRLVPDLHTYCTVQTRRGMHVYFEFDEDILTTQKIGNIDVQTKGKLVIGADTYVQRYDGRSYHYNYLGGMVKRMPSVLRDWCCHVKKNSTKTHKDYEANIYYNYEVTDEECRTILDQMVEHQRDYFTEYSKWITFTAIMKTSNKKEIWDEYSEIYDGNNYDKYKNMKIWKRMKTKISINFFCKLLSIPFIKYHKKVPENELYNEITYYEECTRFVSQKRISMEYDDIVNNDTIILESGTGTGKNNKC